MLIKSKEKIAKDAINIGRKKISLEKKIKRQKKPNGVVTPPTLTPMLNAC